MKRSDPEDPGNSADPGDSVSESGGAASDDGPDSGLPRADRAAVDALPRAWLVVALVLTVAVVVVVVVLAGRARSQGTAPSSGPLAVPAVDQPGATGKACTVLMAALPSDLSGQQRRTLADSQPGVAAWGDSAVVLRCGLETPDELTCSSALEQISGVAWLRLSDPSATTFIAADRAVRIAVTVGPGTGTGPIQQLSEIIAADLPPRDICQSGVLVPLDNG